MRGSNRWLFLKRKIGLALILSFLGVSLLVIPLIGPFLATIWQHVIGYYIAVLLADGTEAWAKRQFFAQQENPFLSVLIMGIATEPEIRAAFSNDYGVDILVPFSIEELCDQRCPHLLDELDKWKKPGELIIEIPADMKEFVFDILVSNFSKVLNTGPLEGTFLLFAVNEEKSLRQGVKVIAVQKSVLQRFHPVVESSDSRKITTEYEGNRVKLDTLKRLAVLVLDENGELHLSEESGQYPGDRDLFGQASSINNSGGEVEEEERCVTRRPIAIDFGFREEKVDHAKAA